MARAKKQAKQAPEATLPQVGAVPEAEVPNEGITKQEKPQAEPPGQQGPEPHLSAEQQPSTDPSAGKKWTDRILRDERIEGETFVEGKPVRVGITVKQIDNHNKGGLGLQMQFDDPSMMPSEAAIQIVKGKIDFDAGVRAGYQFRSDSGKWHEDIMTRQEKDAGVDPNSEEITRRGKEMRDDQNRRFVELVDQLHDDLESGSFRRRAPNKTAPER